MNLNIRSPFRKRAATTHFVPLVSGHVELIWRDPERLNTFAHDLDLKGRLAGTTSTMVGGKAGPGPVLQGSSSVTTTSESPPSPEAALLKEVINALHKQGDIDRSLRVAPRRQAQEDLALRQPDHFAATLADAVVAKLEQDGEPRSTEVQLAVSQVLDAMPARESLDRKKAQLALVENDTLHYVHGPWRIGTIVAGDRCLDLSSLTQDGETGDLQLPSDLAIRCPLRDEGFTLHGRGKIHSDRSEVPCHVLASFDGLEISADGRHTAWIAPIGVFGHHDPRASVPK